jgi:hypothetical protein
MDSAELAPILEKHEKWLRGEAGGECAKLQYANLQGANLQGANLQGANLQGANLQGAKLQDAKLQGANLQDAKLQDAKLQGANLQDAKLQGANLQGANISGVKDFPDAVDWLAKNLEKDERGYIAYKQFGLHYGCPERWTIEPGFVLTEAVHPDPCLACACGVNVGTADWIRLNGQPHKSLWRVLIRWEWLAGVVVPYGTDGKIRCSRAELLEIVPFPTKEKER